MKRHTIREPRGVEYSFLSGASVSHTPSPKDSRVIVGKKTKRLYDLEVMDVYRIACSAQDRAVAQMNS